jgi:hypothetical protein
MTRAVGGLLLAALSVFGCPRAVQPEGAMAAREPACRAPLGEHCKACPTYDEALARCVQELGASVECGVYDERFPPGVTVGACGALRTVAIVRAYDSVTRYFAADGTLVAATVSADYPRYCDGSSDAIAYGSRPRCEERLSKVLCPARR